MSEIFIAVEIVGVVDLQGAVRRAMNWIQIIERSPNRLLFRPTPSLRRFLFLLRSEVAVKYFLMATNKMNGRWGRQGEGRWTGFLVHSTTMAGAIVSGFRCCYCCCARVTEMKIDKKFTMQRKRAQRAGSNSDRNVSTNNWHRSWADDAAMGWFFSFLIFVCLVEFVRKSDELAENDPHQ